MWLDTILGRASFVFLRRLFWGLKIPFQALFRGRFYTLLAGFQTLDLVRPGYHNPNQEAMAVIFDLISVTKEVA
jgi:hypothetical protein